MLPFKRAKGLWWGLHPVPATVGTELGRCLVITAVITVVPKHNPALCGTLPPTCRDRFWCPTCSDRVLPGEEGQFGAICRTSRDGSLPELPELPQGPGAVPSQPSTNQNGLWLMNS